MTDSERYNVLKGKKIHNVPVATNVDAQGNVIISNEEDIKKKVGKEKRNLIKRMASQFDVFKEYSNKDIELDFEFTKNGYEESYKKQGKNFEDFAKMFSVFDTIVHNAVGIEVHNRNKDGYKPDPTLKNVYVLVSAYADGDNIIPVKLEIKQFTDKPNKLYVAVTSDKIKTAEVWKQGLSNNETTQNSRSAVVTGLLLNGQGDTDNGVTTSPTPVNISISDLLRNINPEKNHRFL